MERVHSDPRECSARLAPTAEGGVKRGMDTGDYEKLGAFYLGRLVDSKTSDDLDEPLLYDAKDLTTHAVILGMTGSGKTGLAIALLEEALIDGVPVIAIDPKGDLGNLLLTFPGLAASDFRPWIDESAAARAGQSPDVYAASQARLWKEGLAGWGQGPERIARLEAAAERVLYTPGSSAGTQLSILQTLDAPGPELIEDEEAFRERVLSSVSGLLSLLGIDADPVQSREHILVSTLVDRAWREGRSVDLTSLIHQIQKPPIDRIGILDLETVFPADARLALAMRLNNLLASPGFAAWQEGEPLDIGRMLRAPDGRPRLSIISIAHLSDPERMFVVTMVLSQLVSWMRSQAGSQSLRAILYMDEVYGYFPPTANPPSKKPMLTLLKQARAYGIGCVLSTQNPVDLDYKGLSNCGTWLLGRLQTERDKLRVIDGLESASDVGLDRATLDKTLSDLESRMFLMNNVHDDEPVLLRSRWALSYLAGPMSREQIKSISKQPIASSSTRLVGNQSDIDAAARPSGRSRRGRSTVDPVTADDLVRPLAPSEANERFAPVIQSISAGDRLVYRPALFGQCSAHYASARVGIDAWTKFFFLAPLAEGLDGSPWDSCQQLNGPPDFDSEPEAGATFAPLVAIALRKSSYKKWASQLRTAIYRDHPLLLWKSRKPKLISRRSEEEGAFRGRIKDAVRAERDLAIAKLRKKFAPKLARLQERIARAQERIEREEHQYKDRKTQTAVSLGATLIGAFFGRKLASVGNVGRAASTMKGASRAARERADIGRAEERAREYEEKLEALEADFRIDLESIEDVAADFDVEIEDVRIAAKRGDLEVELVSLVWMPFRLSATGEEEFLGSREIRLERV